MSNINHPNAWHGLDDEPHDVIVRGRVVGTTNRCGACYGQAKTQWFAQKFHRKGSSLQALYVSIHQEAHA